MTQKKAVFISLRYSFWNEKDKVCSFTGYRPSKLPFLQDKKSKEYLALYNLLKSEIVRMSENGIVNFQTGMARGIDLLCGEILLELKRDIDIHVFCAIPCKEQYFGWKAEDITLYKRIIDASDGTAYISLDKYSKGCMQKRNRYLVDTAQYLIAVYDGQRGGTMATINYAKKKHRTIIVLNPTEFTRVELLHSNEEGELYV